jgi:DNA polymerase-3 subunit gamma/tau
VSTSDYQVLARKYRPQSFDDLLGHEAMVRTLRNAFAADRIAHAFILTGVRGVGKTTTARIMARALNYETETIDAPTVDMPAEGRHCRAIAESRHPDVIEMDAASRTGVGDIRELIEGVRYAPVEGRYKVYIIDEVHMLTNNAFNALLKTLEEPPPHVKFIFATTEIRKVPITVLSRCQRFDLKRFDAETLADYLAGIAAKEDAAIDREAVFMLAQAAEGSVRDGLSLLDQAILQSPDRQIEAAGVRDMLGLVDRTQSWTLLEAAMSGETKQALDLFRMQYNSGADPSEILRDLLGITHLLTRTRAAGPEAAAHGQAGTADVDRAIAAAERYALPALTRVWSLLMKALEEVRMAPDPAQAAEIGLVRIAYAAMLPTPDEALKALATDGGGPVAAPRSGPTGGGGGAQALARTAPAPEATPDPGPQITSLADIAQLAATHRDARLRAEIETCLMPVHVAPGRLDIALTETASAELPGKLTRALKEWTGRPWIVSVVAPDRPIPTLREERDREIENHPLVKAALETFPGARITAVRDIEPSEPETDE